MEYSFTLENEKFSIELQSEIVFCIEDWSLFLFRFFFFFVFFYETFVQLIFWSTRQKKDFFLFFFFFSSFLFISFCQWTFAQWMGESKKKRKVKEKEKKEIEGRTTVRNFWFFLKVGKGFQSNKKKIRDERNVLIEKSYYNRRIKSLKRSCD